MLFWRKLVLLIPWRRRAREVSLEEELQSHLEFAALDAAKDGATAEEARRAARRDLGDCGRVLEASRSAWGFARWEQLSRDLVYSLRTLRRDRSFTVVAILSLGVGIGSATAIFSLLNTVLLKPLAYRQPENLVTIREAVAGMAGTYPSLPVNYQHFRYWREHASSFESLAAMQGSVVDLTGGEAARVDSARVTANLFPLLGVQPQLGRSFLPGEGQEGYGNVVIITDSLWDRRFGRSRALLGKTITVDYQPYTVVGILPPGFRFPKNDDLGPLIGLGKNTEVFTLLTRGDSSGWGGDYDYVVFGRLKPNVPLRRAIAELDLLERQIDNGRRLDEGLSAVCRPLQEVISAPVRTPLYVLMGAATLLLLIVCVNLANLGLARSSARSREFSIRVALGAGRGRLVHQILVEASLLALAGGVFGLFLASTAIRSFAASGSALIPRLDEVQLDGRVFLFSLLASTLCGLLSGLLPALRITSGNSQQFLRAGSHTIAGNRQALRSREILIGCEVAISVVLLFGAGLLTQSLARLLGSDKGFTAEQAVLVDLLLPDARYRSDADRFRFWDHALEEIRSIPGIRSAAFISKLPLSGESMVNEVTLDGSAQAALDPVSRAAIDINCRFISPDYFAALGIPLMQGRFFQPEDRDRHVAIVSQRLAAKLWPGQNPVGKKFSADSSAAKVEVVGVVRDVHATALDRESTLIAYYPYGLRSLSYGSLAVRTATGPSAMIPEIRRRIRGLDPSLPVPDAKTIRGLVAESLSRRYFQARLAGGFACVALALALIGIYGVVAYHVAQRRAEVAVRLALGATRSDVFRLLLQRGLRPVAVGLVAGVLAAAASARLIRSLLFGVQATDPLTMLLVLAVLACAAFSACVLPARRAVRLDPAITLRYE